VAHLRALTIPPLTNYLFLCCYFYEDDNTRLQTTVVFGLVAVTGVLLTDGGGDMGNKVVFRVVDDKGVVVVDDKGGIGVVDDKGVEGVEGGAVGGAVGGGAGGLMDCAAAC
jgi:hypothetical protein